MKRILAAVAALLVLSAGALWWVSTLKPSEPLTIENPRIRLVPGGGPMAGYLDLSNHGDQPVRLVAAGSEDYGRIMLHRSIIVDGQSRMEHQGDGVLVVPGKTISFSPGGLHLMLMQPKNELNVGDQVMIRLEFDGIEPSTRSVQFIVVPISSA